MLTSLLNNLNYGAIFILMLLESTVIPVPSELVVAPAAYHAAAGDLHVWLVILFATLGADVGATINYLGGYYLGRPIIYRFANSRFGRLCMLNQEKVEKSEKYFDDHGMVATITGRLIPGIRLPYIHPGRSGEDEVLAVHPLHYVRSRHLELHPCVVRLVSSHIRT